MGHLEFLCRRTELPTRGGRRFYLEDGRQIALFTLGDELVAVDNLCPHQKFPLLHEGDVTNGAVTCPMHGWQFDLRTGECLSGNLAKLQTFRVHLIGEEVYVDVEPDVPKWME